VHAQRLPHCSRTLEHAARDRVARLSGKRSGVLEQNLGLCPPGDSSCGNDLRSLLG